MKPRPHTIQFLLPTASPGEIELVYRELLGVIGDAKKHVRVTTEQYSGILAHERVQLKKLANFFGKEG